MRSSHFPAHLRRRLVRPEPDIDGLPQEIVAARSRGRERSLCAIKVGNCCGAPHISIGPLPRAGARLGEIPAIQHGTPR